MSDGKAVRRSKGIRVNTTYPRPEHDTYYTPPEAVTALLSYEEFEDPIWEPACGDGSIVRVLRNYDHNVYGSDIRKDVEGVGGIDFLQTEKKVPSIITNPPFSLALDFAKHATKLADKVALLARLQLLESAERFHFFKTRPPARVYVFSKRISCMPATSETRRRIMAFAWYVWSGPRSKRTILKWIPPCYLAYCTECDSYVGCDLIPKRRLA